MRTRFLNVDYFVPSPPFKTLDPPPQFLRLPLPRFPPPPRLAAASEELLSCSAAVLLSISLEIESLPIHDALSKFYSDVLPQNVDLRYGGLEIAPATSGKGASDEMLSLDCGGDEISTRENEIQALNETTNVENGRPSGCDTPEDGSQFTMTNNNFKMFQLEAPEFGLLWETSCFCGQKGMETLLNLPKTENDMDMLQSVHDVPYPSEVHESICSVQDISLKYPLEERTYLLEDASPAQGQFYSSCGSFPLLEVDEISLETMMAPSIDQESLLLIENIEIEYETLKDVQAVDGKELLGFVSIDKEISNLFTDHNWSKQQIQSQMDFLNSFTKMDILSLAETSYNQRDSVLDPSLTGNTSASMLSLIFEEFQILDADLPQLHEVSIGLQVIDQLETCDQMLMEDMTFRNFNELIVSHELVLLDDNTFKSLPVPILADEEKETLYVIIRELLAKLKPECLSASDGIYLDWHFLEEGGSRYDISSMDQDILEEIGSSSSDFSQKLLDYQIMASEFIFSSEAEASYESSKEESKESLDMLFDDISFPDGHSTSSELLENGCAKQEFGEALSEIDAEKVSLLSESLSQFNDLDFFLNPVKGIRGANSEVPGKICKTKGMPSVGFPREPVMSHAPPKVQLEQREVHLYAVSLSDGIMTLMDNFQKKYLDIVENETELKNCCHLSITSDCYELFALSKQKLMDCIRKTTAPLASLADKEKIVMALVTLYTIKQMAWCLCFYGIHTTHLYLDKLCRSRNYLKVRLGFLCHMIEDAYQKADTDIIQAHPSLSVIKGILLSNIVQSILKALIVTEQTFWPSLKKLLTSMGISYHELHSDCKVNEFQTSARDILQHSDCVLASHKHISASFPFNEFGMILEYGASFSLSRISTIVLKSIRLPCLHFVKVELKDHSIPKALCEGVDIPQDIEITTAEGNSHSDVATNEILVDERLDELLNSVPVVNNCNVRCSEAADGMFTMDGPVLHETDSVHVHPRVSPFKDIVIVVNTQNSEKEMIISRRSTYQKILAMEKEGAQVVERDSALPADIIISPAICLMWYDCRNIGKEATPFKEASSCLSFCVDNIATNVLTVLSFSFSTCILVFEGEISFISTLMELSEGLYAAAASLGIGLQLFYSYSADLTDEIVLSSIEHATKLTRGLYPRMPESETLAESFLTKFPSINALAAHAIISSVGMLVEFIEWSHERRIMAVEKYHVPSESMALFSALCKYMEREDCKSGMTDCSSSVSSAPGSEKSHSKIGSERNKRKHIADSVEFNMPTDDYLCFVPPNEFTEDKFNHSKAFKLADSGMSGSSQILNKFGGPNISPNVDASSQGFRLNMNSRELNGTMLEDFTGEVIDFSESSLLCKNFPIESSTSFSLGYEVEKEAVARNSRTARRLSFGKSSHPTFPPASQTNSEPEIGGPVNDKNHHFSQDIGTGYDAADFNNNLMFFEQQKKLIEENSTHKCGKSSYRLLAQDKRTDGYGETPFSNAIRSGQLQGSPWTIEFLNRVREKSRAHKQHLRCDAPYPFFGYSGNASNVAKRKSPSTLDLYKYQGGSTPRKINDWKRHKLSKANSTSSKNQGHAAPIIQSWTPLDKRARQTLTFTKSGTGSQTKLVWSSGSAQGVSRRF